MVVEQASALALNSIEYFLTEQIAKNPIQIAE
jgi:hypothetical protein